MLRPLTGKDDSALQSEGYIDIDATGGLVAAHDAATAHLGAPWRMPTDEEHDDLINNCDWTWTTKNGVNGYEVRGQGDYASNSIFLPAAGAVSGASLGGAGSRIYYWSSSPDDNDIVYTWALFAAPEDQIGGTYWGKRFYGQPVRPVQDFR